MAAATGLRPSHAVHGAAQSSFAGVTQSLRACSLSSRPGVCRQPLTVEARRQCQLTGKVANNGYTVTFSHKRNKKLQGVNLQEKKVYWPAKQRWVTLKLSTKAIKTIEKRGLEAMAKDAGLDLNSLPYRDARPGRTEWLASTAGERKPPMSKKRNVMKNPEKLAASKKKPLVAEYVIGNRIRFARSE